MSFYEELPSDLVSLEKLKPVVFLSGGVEGHDTAKSNLLQTLISVTSDGEFRQSNRMDFFEWPEGGLFTEKKNIKETVRPDPSGFSSPGILKANWIDKHTKLLPSVFILLTTFNVDWSPVEWEIRLNNFTNKINEIYHSLTSRDIHIITVAHKMGLGINLEKEILESRVYAMRQVLQSEGRHFFFWTDSDSDASSSASKKLGRTLRELSSAYYNLHLRRFRQYGRVIDRTTDYALSIRYHIKCAIFTELLLPSEKALHNYEQAFIGLCSLMNASKQGLVGRDEQLSQLLVVARVVLYKTIYILLGRKKVADACARLRRLCSRIRLCCHDPQQEWRVLAWLCDQHVMFLGLLSKFNIDEHVDGGVADRVAWFEATSNLLIERYDVAPKVHEIDGRPFPQKVREIFPDLQLSGSIYAGGIPVLRHPQSGEPAVENQDILQTLLRSHLECLESSTTNDSINKAMQLLNMAKAKVSPEHIRHQVLLSYSLAKVMLRLGDSNRALPLLLETVNALYAVSGKNWDSLIGSVLKSIMEACPKVTQPSQALMLATLLSRIEVENQKEKVETEGNDEPRQKLWRQVVDLISTCNIGGECNHHLEGNALGYSFQMDDSSIRILVPPRTGGSKGLFQGKAFYDQKCVEMGTSVTFSVELEGNVPITATEVQLVSCTAVFTTGMDASKSDQSSIHSDENRSTDTDNSKLWLEKDHSLFVPLQEESSKDMNLQGSVHLVGTIDIPYEMMYVESSLCLAGVVIRLKIGSTEVSWNQPCLHPEFSRRIYGHGANRVIETLQFCDRYSPNSLMIQKPVVDLKIDASAYNNGGSSSSHDHGDSNGMETLRILRGCVQRIDLNLMSNRDAVRDGVMYVSSDVRPMSSKDAVFWYPSSTSKSSYQFPEFTAMTIKDGQPAAPLLLPTMASQQQVAVPLFVRIQNTGLVTINLRVDYVPRDGLSSEDSDSVVTMNRSIIVRVMECIVAGSYLESCRPDSGVMRPVAALAPTLLPRERAHLLAAVSCPTGVCSGILIEELCALQSAETIEDNENLVSLEEMFSKTEKKGKEKGRYHFLGESSGIGDLPIEISPGESVSGQLILQCHDTEEQTEILPVKDKDTKMDNVEKDTSEDNVYDSPLALPIAQQAQQKHSDNQSKQNQSVQGGSNNAFGRQYVSLGEVSVIFRDSKSSTLLTPPHTSVEAINVNNIDLPWVPKLGVISPDDIESASTSVNSDALDRHVCCDVTSHLTFRIPQIQILKSPFAVQLSIPEEAVVGMALEINVKIHSFLNTWSRLKVVMITSGVVENNDDSHAGIDDTSFIPLGLTDFSVECGPLDSTSLVFQSVPVKSGLLPCPKFRIYWLKQSETLNQATAIPVVDIVADDLDVARSYIAVTPNDVNGKE